MRTGLCLSAASLHPVDNATDFWRVRADAGHRAASVDDATIADVIAIFDELLAGLSGLVEELLAG